MNAKLMSELFGGAARYRALRTLFEHADRGFGARELGASAGIDPGAASRWLRRWADIGLLDRHQQRRQTVYQASADAALEPLRQLMQQDGEVVRVLRARLEEFPFRVEAAAIFGSVARGDARSGSDIDLLLITAGSQLRAQAHFKPAGRKLGRPVNVLSMAPQEWAKARRADALVLEILSHPLIHLQGDVRTAQA